jgi:opacity protein-like surface antigen
MVDFESKIMKISLKPLFISIGVALYSSSTFAWDHGVTIGYGYAKELGESYINKGFLLDMTLYKIQADSKLDFSLKASTAYWKAGTTDNNTLFTAGIGIGARAYFTRTAWISPYIHASISPSYISAKKFGNKEQGSHFVFQDTFGFGVEIGPPNGNKIDINYMFIHYSNANLFTPNNGYDIPAVVNIGYLF